MNESLIASALDQMATILIRAGVDVTSAEKLLRSAFIRAASRAVESATGKITQSQVATTAGVTRLEVRRFAARTRRQTKKMELQPNSRVNSVIEGWQKDGRYCNKAGKPRPLTFKGIDSEFGELVRRYGRDVTAKTIRLQLVNNGFAQERGCTIQLRRDVSTSKQATAASADLRYIASQLANIDFELGRRAYLTRRISIVARDKKSIMAIQRIATTRLETVLSSLKSFSKEQESSRGKERLARHRLLLSSTIALETGERR